MTLDKLALGILYSMQKCSTGHFTEIQCLRFEKGLSEPLRHCLLIDKSIIEGRISFKMMKQLKATIKVVYFMFSLLGNVLACHRCEAVMLDNCRRYKNKFWNSMVLLYCFSCSYYRAVCSSQLLQLATYQDLSHWESSIQLYYYCSI